jgi:Flp pilus assembly protein TadD
MAHARPTSDLMNRIRLQAILLCFAWLLGAATAARADDLTDVKQLAEAGKPNEAMIKLDALLATRPKDAQLRFLKGVLLTQTRHDDEAIAVFLQLNEDYPELAEPYNNLAVLYAAKGQYDKARVALEAAVRGNPGYATAYENLGDVYARLAAQAFARALALEGGNAALPPKIAQLNMVFTARPVEPRTTPP